MIYTLTTMTPDFGLTTTVHASYLDAVDTLRENFAADFDGPSDAVEDYVTRTQPDVLVSIEQHDNPAEG